MTAGSRWIPGQRKHISVARILIHSLVFPPDAITNAYILSDLARELKTTFGHELMVLTTTPHYNLVDGDIQKQPMVPVFGNWLLKSDFDGITCYHVRVPSAKGGVGTRVVTAARFHLLGLLAMWRIRWKCDVVISQSPPLSIGLVGAWIARILGAKAVYIVQDIFPDGLIRQRKIRSRLLIAALRGLEKWVYRSSDAVCGISDGFARVLRPRVPVHRLLEVIPNFVNTDVYRPLPRMNDYARERGLVDQFVVSYVGNIGNAQDFSAVLAAARACKGLPIKFVMVGDGIRRAGLAADAAAQGLGNIEFWGYQPRESTPWINASSDLTLVLLAPHVGSYGFPSKVFTLMSSERAILLVADPESDIAHLIAETGAGWVVPCSDTDGFVRIIRQAMDDRAGLAARAEAGGVAVRKQFTVPVVARRYHDLVMRLCVDRAAR